ncbi:MAG: thiamine-phosphate pyrophosphorylase [Lentimonas sp.]|jgi:thiamine-phosphate pyrophosphorylase
MSQIYLISPPEIDLEIFSQKLEEALQTRKIAVFQLRLKNYPDDQIVNIGKKLNVICQKYQTPFILNDRFDLALKIDANGVHLGSDDGNISNIRQEAPEDFIIGVSCYDSKHLAASAVESGADYVSFGTFFPSKTKNSQGKPNFEILNWCEEVLPVPMVAIGGINAGNCQDLIKNKADFLAVISYVWDNSKGVTKAIEDLSKISS